MSGRCRTDRRPRTPMSLTLPERYLAFARDEAEGRSALYEAFSVGVAHDAEMLALLSALPVAKQQPNLLFAAVKYALGVQPDWPSFRAAALRRWNEVRSTMMARSTQTNEAARCATLLPALMQLPQPLALLEVGASAGLCLLPDRYAYDFDGHHLTPESATVPLRFACHVEGAVPLPQRLPQIV